MVNGSDLQGFRVPGTIETLKATLFADDTMVYLSEFGTFAVLQDVLNTWCSAAKAKFNIEKTEIIPIGQLEYRMRINKLVSALKRWKMMVGEMTQFLTDVQQMPMTVLKCVNKIMCNYLWDNKHNILVSMAHMIQHMDLETCNKVIDVMWLQLYLVQGNLRP
ncbi:hypothetical protein BC628DRAFT_1410349 [Trametes gibbosa]|nr:hypothetical protein BC628DRAFT_1410349 [Trametes gibbosa]